ncbi:ABC transporter permease/substrate-binding protein [Streptococcus hillyeri]|uniref:ABC transporter permease/substrate-binding protein n=1 Tax=Streptococcus hillyeri TaxID=2282420 RepID=A0A3L9DRD9_9STRE|nr:ABC transporter permease/substrate-binding protein [Streptococcus hillyeri]RLY02788.1 ABC transporter permease/substrate-binding protein [Streptococcus hillyeri]
MTNLITTFQDRFDEWLLALIEHLQISLIALLIAIVISVPLAILLSKNKRWAELSLQMTGIFQTIPSLALLGLFIPFMGIGTLPAVVALVTYAIFPIMQNTITALDSIDPSLVEAGTAFGMTKWERLKTFEVPISLPIIMSGIRTSAVMIIGTATLASLIGAGGLGSFIMLGIDRNNSSLILLGALSSAVLAVLFNAVLKLLEKAKLRTILVTLLAIVSGLFVSYAPALFPKNEPTKETITVAGKLGAEPEILINMYKELIEQDTDIRVELKPSFGKTSFLYEALKAGQIDIYPEFTGTVTGSLLKNSPQLSNDPETVFEAAREGILAQDNLVMLRPMAYQNTYALAVTRDFAEEHGLTKISDLAKVQDQLVAGFSLEFNDRADGYPGLQKLYGLNFKVNTMEPSLRYQAIQTGDVNLIDAYSTDSQIKQYDLVVLEDDKQLFPPYQGAPLLKKELLDKYPELEKVLNRLAGKISESDMSEMNYQVDVKGKPAAEVAHTYLVENGFIEN